MLGGLVAAGGACSLKNIKQDPCASTTDCAVAFGAGSVCKEGFCTDPGGCQTDEDCIAQAGSGKCIDGACTDTGCSGTRPDGSGCYACAPQESIQFLNACVDAQCAPFDNATRLTRLEADGTLPPLPAQ